MTTTFQPTIGFLLADLSRLMRHLFSQKMTDGGLSLAQARVLYYIKLYEGIRQVDLAELLEIKPITLSRILDQFEMQKIILRQVNPHDKRVKHISLLPAAQPILEKLKQIFNDICEDALQNIDAEQRAVAEHVLSQMRNNLSSSDLLKNLCNTDI